jgi:hypothetical protein
VARARIQITDRDRELLRFLAAHRLALADQVQALLRISAAATSARLRPLSRAGLIHTETVFHRQPACHQITRKGLAAIGSELPPPRLDLRGYRHDVGLGWLWLAARAGTFGPVSEIVSERQMRSHDGIAQAAGEQVPFGVKLGGVGPGGRDRLHYPDLVLRTASGHRVAVELELSPKGRGRRERILASYGAERRIDAVLYLVEDPAVGRAIRGSAARLGLSDIVHVQRCRWSGPAPGVSERGLGRTPRPAASREATR